MGLLAEHGDYEVIGARVVSNDPHEWCACMNPSGDWPEDAAEWRAWQQAGVGPSGPAGGSGGGGGGGEGSGDNG